MRRIYAFFCALFCAFALFANDVTGFVALEFGGNKTSYLIKNVQHVDINNMPDGKAEMSVLRKDGVSMPNVRTLIFTDELLFQIQFVNYDGTVLQSSEMSEGEMPTYTGATPTRESTAQYIYTFNGWEPTMSPVVDNVTYTATYSQQTQKYTIQFVNYDGTVLQSDVLEYGAMPSFKGENPTKSSTAQYAYAFTGWDSEPTVVTESKVFTAMYSSTVNSYTVSFVNDNGDVLQSSQLAYGATPVYNGATPEKAATAEFTYTFKGWSPAITMVEGAQTYTATYSSVKKQYEVIYKNEDGTVLQRSDVTYGETPKYNGATPTKPATAEFTYTFKGWSPAITMVEGAQTYTATYSSVKNQYEVVFQNEDGTELQRSNVTYGETPKYIGEIPTKAATAEFTYTFAGWSPAISVVTGAQTYTATYSSIKNQYEVIFQNEDGTELQRSNVTYGETPKYNGETPTKAATAEFTYTFAGWSPAISVVTGPQTYTATFNAVKNQYEVIFQNEDGTELQRSNVTYGETPKYNGETPVKEATAEFTYTFKGWSPAITVVEGAQTYTATYSSVKNQYEVVFQNEDGTELQRSNVTYGETPKYNGETPTKATTAEFTYTFAGWSPSITSVTGAQTYTATYSSVKNQYEVIFQNEDGTELQRSNVTYGETPKYNGETPTKAATAEFTYTFAGWSPAITVVEGAQTYTATYSSVKNQYEVIFQNEDGTELQRSNVTYGETPKYNGETPVKEATAEFTYTFAGWSPAITSVTGAQTYTATFNAVKNQYEVIFQNEDGTELQRGNVTYGETPKYNGETPVKEATAEFTYTFAGWSPAITVVEGAQTYTATYSSVKNQYEVIFKNEDGTELQRGNVTYGETPKYNGETPTKAATAEFTYTFAGWSPSITVVEGAQTYTATYSSVKNQYEVIFQNEDGAELQRSNVTYGETPVYIGETPVKAATAEFTYTFAGWSPAITIVEGAKVYTATYSSVKNQYEIIFQNEDGTELQRSNVTYGETPVYSGETPTKAATAEYTYTFAGWSPAITVVEGAQTYTATYSSVKNQYEVIFQNEDGTELQRSNVTYGETPVYAGATPIKDATAEFTYTFAGWSPSITVVEGAQTYTATYSSVKNQYEVIFQNEDGTELQRSNVTYGETPKYTGETPIKASTQEITYTFAGWSPTISVVTNTQTYTATYTAVINKYTLTAIPQHEVMGVVTGSGTYDYGTQVVVIATPKFGYDFDKWDNGLTEKEIIIEIVSDLTVIALFTENYCEQHATPEIPTIEVQPIAVWGSKLNLTESDNAIKEAISQQEGKIAEIKESWWEVNFNGEWETYNGQIVPKQETIKVRFALTTICDKTAKGEAETLIVQCPNPENTEACKNAPSVNKYDWLLMLNVNEIKAQGYVFEEKDVTWYRITDNGNPQVVGNGYSYTIDRSLLGTGDYYARIELPTQTNDVACKCIYGTQTYSFDGDVLPTPMLMPSIVGPNERVEVLNLPMGNAEIKVYDKVGKIYYSIESNGRSKVEFLSQDLPGQYLVEVKTPATKVTLKYVVR